MTLLILYVLIALGFSFLCSIAEAVLLSVSTPHIVLLEREGHRAGPLLRSLKNDINTPLAAILTLNTVAHTIGAAGAGAQAAAVYGSAYVGIASAILTLLILVFSEIIPKTLGALYWRQLAPMTAYLLRYLVIVLYPFVKLSALLTNGMARGSSSPKGLSRDEMAAIADLGSEEGELGKHESSILKNLFLLRNYRVTDVMTPRPVIYSLKEGMTVNEYFSSHANRHFSRVPIYRGDPESITGFVIRNDLLLAQARGNIDKQLRDYKRELMAVAENTTLLLALELFIEQHQQMLLIVDEYGGVEGLITMEDVLETLIGLEIVDESDITADMQRLARKRWRRRAREMGLMIEE